MVDAWVGQAPTPAEEDAVAKMEQVEITIPAAEPEEYHTYKFNIEDLADEYIVREGLVDPNDDDFEDMTPVELSIVVDQAKDKAYEGKVRVAPINADGLQLWAKDTEDKWHDINQVGWGPAEGFPIDPELVTEVYVIATEALDDNVTLKLVDVTGDYGAEDNIIISQEVAVKAVKITYSNYTISSTAPDTVYVDQAAEFTVSVKGDGGGDTSYTAIYRYEITGGDYKLEYKDGEEWKELTGGYFGPPSGFELTPDWEATTNIRFTALEKATYNMVLKLETMDGVVLASKEHSIEAVAKAITLEPESGEATVVQGAELEESTVTLSSNYNAEGLKTFISLAKDDASVNFDSVFEEFILATKVGDKEDGPYNMVCADSTFQYGPSGGFAIEAGVDQVTTITGKVKADALLGTYVITTEVKAGDEVLATATYTLEVVEETSLTMTAADVDATTGEEFTMAVTAQGTVADADKEHKVRFYGVIPDLAADDIEFATIPGGTPEIVTNADERGYAGANEGDLVLAWGPAGGFPLKDHDYSQGVTTEFKATIKEAGNYTVTFVFYDITGERQLNGEDETATITVTDS